MQSYSLNDFNKDDFVFRWQHPDIRQTYWTREEVQWNNATNRDEPVTANLTTIWYKDERMLQLYTKDNVGHRALTIYKTHRDEAKAHGIMLGSGYYANATTIIDGLYYIANKPKYYNQNGTLKKGFYGQLNRRLRSQTISQSWVTQSMLDEAVKINKQEYDTLAEGIRNSIPFHVFFIDKMIDHDVPGSQYYRDSLVDKFFVHGSSKVEHLGILGRTRLHVSTNPADYGYQRHETQDLWLLPTQFAHRGRVYNRSEVSIVECTECGHEAISTECVNGVCPNCLDSAYKIHNYSTRVEGMLKFKAKKVKPTTIYLGCELEYETNNRNKAAVDVGKLLKGHALMKSDGSIRNGFEIVTCPATLDIHLETFKNFYDNIPPDLKIEKNVGMHVHISRKPLSQLTLGKMAEFLNRLDNKQFIAHIAGRIDNEYAKQDEKRNVTYPWKAQRHGGGDRYNALNLQNSNTVEIRLFATPMDYKTFAMRLQFCQALVDYCQPAQTNLPLKQQTQFGSFINWVRQERYSYPELNTHLKGFN